MSIPYINKISATYVDNNAITVASVDNNTLAVNGNANITGKLTVNGRDLAQVLERIEHMLGMLTINPQLESEFEELRKLGDLYRDAEKRFLEQKRIFNTLKSTDL